ncbi:HmuY family protein [uncultured Capnocytophaga sp.]|jgi:hypothetical protein|uniref:HmuY family protein n=1 Tax=uncultured Capnocytophaga sp. TaxID=159273 RepID=UPI0028ED7294|nr:HmuY family protein [uncultured Capnocytophaga sp.]
MKMNFFLPALLAGMVTLSSCSKDDNKSSEQNQGGASTNGGEKKIENLDASKKQWVYFSFEKGTTVTPTTPETDLTWDVAFNSYAVKLNGGTSGKGQAEAISADSKDFAAVTKAPTGTFVKDKEGIELTLSYKPYQTITTSASPLLTGGFGVTTGTINIAPTNMPTWPSVYAPTKNVYVLKTATGKLVKFQVTDFYSDKKVAGFITFIYKVSTDGNF